MPGAMATDWTGAETTPDEDARLAAYYDLQYGFAGDAPRWPDVDWFRSVASGTGGPVLELGCGSGRIAVALAADGYTVVGVDRSPAMLLRARERARAAGVAAEFVSGDLRDFSLGGSLADSAVLPDATRPDTTRPDTVQPNTAQTNAARADTARPETTVRRFPLVIVPFNTFLMLPPGDRRACLARVRAHLAPDGQLAIDVFQPDPERIAGFDGGVLDEGTHRDDRTDERVTFFTSTKATVDRTTQTLRIDAVGPDGLVHRYERVLTLHFLYRQEAELLLDQAGFEVLSVHGDREGTPADERSPRLLIVARRRDRGERGDRRR